MASFFRWRIADKVIPFLAKCNISEKDIQPSRISSFVRVCRTKGKQPKLTLPWKKFVYSCSQPEYFMDPKELVRLLRNQGLPTAEGFTDITFCDAPTSIVFTVDKHVYSKIVLMDICANEEIVGKSSCLFQDIPKKKIVVQCSAPQIGEPFRITHFRSAIHSNFISNINKMAGHEVVKIVHVADWGLTSAALLTGLKEFGVKEELLNCHSQDLFKVSKLIKEKYENDFNFKNNVQLCFEKMKQGDQKIISEWNYLKDLCLKQYASVYEKIGLTFDETLFDSLYLSEIDKMQEELLNRKLVSFEGEGKIKIDVPVESDMENSFLNDEFNPIVFNMSRNICSAIQVKNKHNFDEMYYAHSIKEADFFTVWCSLIKKLGFHWSENLHHVELHHITDITERRKNQMDVDGLLDYAKKGILNQLKAELYLEMDENLEKMADILSFASLCVYDMKHKRNVDYKFSWKDILSFERDSGISLQLCHAGLKGLQDDSPYEYQIESDTSPLLESSAHDLAVHLSRFDEMVYKSYLSLEPYIILQYLFSLWYFVDRAANVLKLDIKSDRLVVIKARLMLLSATLKVLQKGLYILGITPYETNYSPPDFIKP